MNTNTLEDKLTNNYHHIGDWWNHRPSDQKLIMVFSLLIILIVLLYFSINGLTNRMQTLNNQLPILRHNAQLSEYYLQKINQFNQTTNQPNLIKIITQSLIPFQTDKTIIDKNNPPTTQTIIESFSEPIIKIDQNKKKSIEVKINSAQAYNVFNWIEDIQQNQSLNISIIKFKINNQNEISGLVIFSED